MRTKLGLLLTLGLLTVCVTSRADPLAVDAKAPAVTGITETGAKLDFCAVYPKGYTLVYFYPMADSHDCTAEGCSLRDAWNDLVKMGVTVIGVSVDDKATQKAFKEKNHFPFTLIADPDHTVIDAFGVPLSEQWGSGPRAMRESFLIDKCGKIVWRDLKASTTEHAADVLKALKDLCGCCKADTKACGCKAGAGADPCKCAPGACSCKADSKACACKADAKADSCKCTPTACPCKTEAATCPATSCK